MSSKSGEKIYRLRTDADWEAMSSPIRIEIVSVMEMLGVCSIAEIARPMGRKPDSLYHHVRRLQDAGIVLADGFRKVGRQTEALYRLRAEVVLVRYDPDSERDRENFARVAQALMRMTQRDFVAALTGGRGVIRFEGAAKNIWLRREVVRVTPKTATALRPHIEAILSILEEARHETDGRPHALTLVMNPLVDRDESEQAGR